MKKNISIAVVSLALGMVLAGGVAYAWNAMWHDPSTWVSEGSVIDAQKMGESLQYLYGEIAALKAGGGTSGTGTSGTGASCTIANSGRSFVLGRGTICTGQWVSIMKRYPQLYKNFATGMTPEEYESFVCVNGEQRTSCPSGWLTDTTTSYDPPRQGYEMGAGPVGQTTGKNVTTLICTETVFLCE